LSLEMLLDHKCDIYHVTNNGTTIGYGLPDSPSFMYNDIPDISKKECHFCNKGSGLTLIQMEPQTEINGRIKLVLPLDTDVRVNDKVVNCDNGMAYRAELPKNIRNHHTAVYINREDGFI